MPAFAPGTHKFITSASENLNDALPVDARDAIARLFLDLGVYAISAANSPPSDKDVLWWHMDVRTFKRWDGVQGNWFPLTGNQMALHILRRAVLGSVQEINLETGDLFLFWDVSAGELKKISKDDLSANIVRDAMAALSSERLYVDTSISAQIITLPASPANNDRRRVYDRKGTFSSAKSATIARNGKTINLSATNLILDLPDIGVELTYNATTNDWQITEFFRSNVR
ncbi:MAG TPA: hypothetical protein VIL30_04455 [Ramlibacter sp.]|jgi:hypothetical protein